MRLLVYGMQSSGATAFTRVLAERPDCVAMVDIVNNFAAPRVTTTADFVAKVVITTAYPLAVHAERFCPDRIVLVLRDPRDNYQSLRDKNYRNYSGLIDEKFQLLDKIFAEREARFDAVVHYEDFIARDPATLASLAALGWPVTADDFQFRRDYNEMLGTLWAHEPKLRDEMDMVFGNSRGEGITDKWRDKAWDAALEARLERLCPAVLEHYRHRPALAGADHSSYAATTKQSEDPGKCR